MHFAFVFYETIIVFHDLKDFYTVNGKVFAMLLFFAPFRPCQLEIKLGIPFVDVDYYLLFIAYF